MGTKIYFIIFMILMNNSGLNAGIKMPAVFGDNMVLQRDKAINVWGSAFPNEKITVMIDRQEANTITDNNGRWSVNLKPMSAGGPYQMLIKGNTTITFDNVLIGDVWLASGQSNMEFVLSQVNEAGTEIKNANYPKIRVFNVTKKFSFQHASDVKGKWLECSSKTIGGFSAVAYFFGRKLHLELNVPIGLINSSWGGTAAEPWMSKEGLASEEVLKPLLKVVKSFPVLDEVDEKKSQKQLAEWQASIEIRDPGNKGFENGWHNFDFDHSLWDEMSVPQSFENAGLDMDGAVWFRKEIIVPDLWLGKDLLLHLSRIDDFDVTYFNGVKVGETGVETPQWYLVPRKYVVPSNIVKPGKNIIAVRIFDRFLSGGFLGVADDMKIFVKDSVERDAINLSGKWKYKVEVRFEPAVITPDSLQNVPTVLYNAMISPIISFAIKGAIWYQGESHTGMKIRAEQYRKVFSSLINDWRKKWNDDFPFLFVQLANFQPPVKESSWPEVRESQLFTLALPNTGMAVTIDIGDALDIHPKNKQDVGYRLALAALAKVYGKNIVYSGPIYRTMEIEGNRIRLKFNYAEGGLIIKGPDLTGFTIAGEDKQFYPALASVQNDEVVVYSDKVKNPIAVRYGWENNPKCNLYNNAGLPASPFRTDKCLENQKR